MMLPAIEGYERLQASIEIELTAASPLQIDDGAQAFGNISTRQVEATAPPTVLLPSLQQPAEYYAPTIDAAADDPDVLQALTGVGCDADALFRYVRDEVAYEAYKGSLRGAKGTVWGMAGNSLDQSSLLVALLRACGTPARYVSGTLADADAQTLVLSMFEPGKRVLGGLDTAALPGLDLNTADPRILDGTLAMPGADQISDPANDPALLGAAREHHWVEAFDGGSWVTLDPSFEAALPGDSFAAADDRYAAVPDGLRHKVEFKLVAEEYPLDWAQSFLAAAYTIDPSNDFVRNGVKPVADIFVQEVEVLERTIPTVSLVGQPVRFGHFLDHFRTTATVEFVFNTYSPWMQIGDDPELYRGTDYQEAMATIVFDLAKLISGVFLRMTTIDSEGNTELHEHTILDRIGAHLRSGGMGEVPADLSGDPVFLESDVVVVNVSVSSQHPNQAARDLNEAIAVVGSFSET